MHINIFISLVRKLNLREVKCVVTKLERKRGNSLAVQWLELYALTIEGLGLIPDWGTKIPQALWYGQIKINNNNNRKR